MDDQMQTAPQAPSDDQTGGQIVPPAPDPQSDQTTEVKEAELEISTITPTPPAPPASNGDFQSDSQHYDEEIKSEKIETKRKTFFLDLKANNMGRYVKISERSSGKRSTIIVPEENISEFIDKIKGLFS